MLRPHSVSVGTEPRTARDLREPVRRSTLSARARSTSIALSTLLAGACTEHEPADPVTEQPLPSRVSLFAHRIDPPQVPNEPLTIERSIPGERIEFDPEQVAVVHPLPWPARSGSPLTVELDGPVELPHGESVSAAGDRLEVEHLPARFDLPLSSFVAHEGARIEQTSLGVALLRLPSGGRAEVTLPRLPEAATVQWEIRARGGPEGPAALRIERRFPGEEWSAVAGSPFATQSPVVHCVIPRGDRSELRVECEGGIGSEAQIVLLRATCETGAHDRVIVIDQGSDSEPGENGIPSPRTIRYRARDPEALEIIPATNDPALRTVMLLAGRSFLMSQEPLSERPLVRCDGVTATVEDPLALAGIEESLHAQVLAVLERDRAGLAPLDFSGEPFSDSVVLVQPEALRRADRALPTVRDRTLTDVPDLVRVEIDEERRPALVIRPGHRVRFQIPRSRASEFRMQFAEFNTPRGPRPNGVPGQLQLELRWLDGAGNVIESRALGAQDRGSWESFRSKLPSAATTDCVLEIAAEGPSFTLTAGGQLRLHSVAIAEPRLVRPQARPRGVLLYLVDTLRADRMQLYGAERDTTPRLCALENELVVFDQAYANCSWTRPSTASLLTGLHPLFHGAYDQNRLASEVVTLAERLQGAGFATAAIVANPNVSGSRLGFDRGFDTFRRAFGGGGDLFLTPAESFRSWCTEWLDEHEGEPWFLYVHSVDPHSPYTPEREELARYDADYAGSITGLHQGPGAFEHFPDPTERDVDYLFACYDAEIRGNDASIDNLIGELRTRDLWDDCHFVLTSDHGEEFQERGGWLHGQRAWQEQLWIPMVWKLPKSAAARARRSAHRVQLSDVAPTLCDLLELPGETEFSGDSFAAVLLSEEHDQPRRTLLFDEAPHVRALLQDHWKLIDFEPETSPRSLALFHLTHDSAERHDLASAEPERVETMRRVLDDFLLELHEERGLPVPDPDDAHGALTPEEMEMLRRVGYRDP